MNAQRNIKMFWSFLILSLLFPLSSLAQITFERTYGGIGNDEGWSVQQTTDKGYVIVGSTGGPPLSEQDVYLIKTDSLGDTLWTRIYGGKDWDGGRSVQQTSDGGYVIAGNTTSFGDGGLHVYLIKTDSLGDTLWTRIYGTGYGNSVKQTSDKGFIITGSTQSISRGSPDLYVVKTNSLGDTIWTRFFGGTDWNEGHSVQQTSDGGYIITGETRSFGRGALDVYLIKMDSSGDTLWTRTYGSTAGDLGLSVQQTLDGGYIISGWSYSSSKGREVVYLVKTDSLGDTLWTRTHGGDWGYSVRQTSDGGYIIAGTTGASSEVWSNIYLIKTDSLGDTLWTRTYGGTGWNSGNSVQQTSDGGFIITGNTSSTDERGSDVYLIKTDENGIVEKVEDDKD